MINFFIYIHLNHVLIGNNHLVFYLQFRSLFFLFVYMLELALIHFINHGHGVRDPHNHVE